MALTEQQKEIALPDLPPYIAKGNLGVCYYDGFQMQQYAVRYVDAVLAALPASEPSDTCFGDIELAEMILSDCGCSTINNRALVDRVADRIARHKSLPASEQKPEPVSNEFDYCEKSPDKVHSESWFSNGNCDHCGSGAQNAPLFYTHSPDSAARIRELEAERDALLRAVADHVTVRGEYFEKLRVAREAIKLAPKVERYSFLLQQHFDKALATIGEE